MLRRTMLMGVAAIAAAGVVVGHAGAQEVLKMGISIPMTGAGFNAVGRQLASGIKLYVQQHGDIAAGRKIEIIVRDDGGVADNARRIVQEMIVNEKVGLIGIGITPTSLAIAPLVTEAKIPTLVLSSGASITVTKSPYMVRAGFVLAQQSWIMAEWAAQERQQTCRYPGQRLGARHRSRNRFPDPLHPGRRRNHRGDPYSARQSRLRTIPAADPRHQAGHRVHLFPRSAGRYFRQTVHRARTSQFRHQDYWARRPDRRRRPQHDGRSDARHGHRRPLFGCT